MAGSYSGTLPFPSLEAYDGNLNADVTLPMATLAARASSFGSGTLPMATINASGGPSTFTGTDASLPFMTLAALGGGTSIGMVMPMPTISATGTVTGVGNADLSLPFPTLTADATIGGTGNASLTLPMATIQASGVQGAVGNLAGILPMCALAASATRGGYGNANLTLPMLVTTPTGRAVLTLPMMNLSATGAAVVAVTYEAYVVNLLPSAGYRESAVHETTRYAAGWQFDQIIRWRNAYYGVKSTGLYLLGGDQDAGADIAWNMTTGQTNMGSRQLKACRVMDVHGRVGTGLRVSARIAEAATGYQSYPAIVQAGELAQATRAKFGRGLKAVYWSFALADTGGGAADIDALQLEAAELTRKVF